MKCLASLQESLGNTYQSTPGKTQPILTTSSTWISLFSIIMIFVSLRLFYFIFFIHTHAAFHSSLCGCSSFLSNFVKFFITERTTHVHLFSSLCLVLSKLSDDPLRPHSSNILVDVDDRTLTATLFLTACFPLPPCPPSLPPCPQSYYAASRTHLHH